MSRLRFLSAEWLDELAAAAAAATLPADIDLVLQQVVTGGPEGEVAYAVRVRDGNVSVTIGPAADAHATLTQDWATAAAVHRGELDPQEAFMTGRLHVSGDVQRLMRYQDALAMVDEVFAELRVRTTYE